MSLWHGQIESFVCVARTVNDDVIVDNFIKNVYNHVNKLWILWKSMWITFMVGMWIMWITHINLISF